MAGGKRKFTAEEKGQIFRLLEQGASIADVARQLKEDPRRIGGLFSTWRNQGLLPAAAGDGNSWHPAPTTSFSPIAPPTLPPVESSPPSDSWYTSPTARYGIERTDPADGYLGTLHGVLDSRQFSWRYGRGSYRISVSEGGYLIKTILWVVDDWYGPPRFPPAGQGWEADGWRPLPEEWL